jgi:NAD(P)-dependent dehydrogenase (short-subunit alcohol dehydrogenase family)
MQSSVLITGATGGLGAAVVKKLQAEGHRLLAPASSAASVQALQALQIEAAALDLSDEAAVAAYVRELAAHHDVRAALFLAGGFAAGGLAATSGAELRKMIALNFETAFFLARELMPLFERRGGGQFILIGAQPALQPEDGQHLAAYALSKGMVFHLAELINAAGKGKGIDATVIVPSTLDTPANRQAMPHADASAWVSPEALAEAVGFILSSAGQQMRQTVLKLYNES